MFEDTECYWKLFAYETSSKRKKKYFEKNILNREFLYRRNKENDYKNIESNLILNPRNQEEIKYLTDRLYFSPKKGKRKYKGISKIKKILPHKHLGPRSGSLFHLKFPYDENGLLFRNKIQSFELVCAIIDKEKQVVYVEFRNKVTNDVLFLANHTEENQMDGSKRVSSDYFDELRLIQNPIEVLNKQKSLSNLKKLG